MSLGRLKIGAALVLCAPFMPMLFQGEEWAASTPFQYFTDLGDAHLRKAVTNGRRREFRAFGWPADAVPDPQALTTFERSILRWDEVHEGVHAHMLAWYRQLIELRRVRLIASEGDGGASTAWYDSTRNLLAYAHADLLVCSNLGEETARVPEAMGFTLLLSSDDGASMEDTPTLKADSVAVWSDAGTRPSS
jgi:maltooligosyltrehalose trehalohydrolase